MMLVPFLSLILLSFLFFLAFFLFFFLLQYLCMDGLGYCGKEELRGI